MDDDIESEVVDQVLSPGKINISHELATALPVNEVLTRTHHHFQHSDFTYHQVSRDTFSLRVKSRKHPLFGSFIGKVHVFEKVPFKQQNYHDYAIEGLLEYRISLLWLVAVLSFFFLVGYVFKLGFWPAVLFEVFGTALVIYSTHKLGTEERDEVEERVEASFLLLRSTLRNLR